MSQNSPGLEPLELPSLEEEPLVSVLVANYNYGQFMQQALNSLLEQTYTRFEALVCDDGSTDNSCLIVEEFARRDPRIRLFGKENGGVASALNVAFSQSRGSILCLLDADDYFHPEKIERVSAAFRTNGWGLLVHPLMVVDAGGNPIQRKPAFDVFEEGWIAERTVRRGGRWMYMEASAVCFRREVAQEAFPIDESALRTWADAYICILGALLGPIGYVSRDLARYRLHGANVSGHSALSAAQASKNADSIRRVVRAVESRLSSLGRQCELDVTRNLIFLESSFQAALFGGQASRLALLRSYILYARSVVQDDIYSRARKLLVIFSLGTALVLPKRFRAAWVSAAMTESRFKERARALTSKIVSRSPDHGSNSPVG